MSSLVYCIMFLYHFLKTFFNIQSVVSLIHMHVLHEYRTDTGIYAKW